MQQPYSNPALVRYLVEKYYQNDRDSPDSEFVSSHWKHFSALFDVQVNPEGIPVSMQGEGFGEMKWHGLRHRLLDQACALAYFAGLPHKLQVFRLLRTATKVCRKMRLDPTVDVVRQLFSLGLIMRHLSTLTRDRGLRFLIIGDGYGVMSSLVKTLLPKSTIAMVDIGKTLLFQACYCQMAHPSANHQLVDQLEAHDSADFVYCPTESLESLERFKYDVAINIASMQEMNAETINRYFGFLRNHLESNNLFYCLNRDRKTLVGGEESEFLNYPWRDADQHLVDEHCPWYEYYFAQGTPGAGRYLLGTRLPLVNLFDGTHSQRLSILETN